MSPAKNYFAWQSWLVRREMGARVIEVGCGIGNFSETMLDREAVLGVDIDAGCVSQFRRRFQACSNVGVHVCDVTADEFLALSDFRADSCIALNVLEHIADDRSALGRMARVVQPGGTIVLLVPAFAALYGPIDRNLGHFRRYNRKTIHDLARSLNLQVAKLSFVNFVGFFGWWINARVLKLRAQSENQIAAFDRWIVPAMSRVEKLAPPPLGQSLLAVLKVP